MRDLPASITVYRLTNFLSQLNDASGFYQCHLSVTLKSKGTTNYSADKLRSFKDT